MTAPGAGASAGASAGAGADAGAGGGQQQREYPWGSMAPGTQDQYAIYGCYYPNPPASDGGAGACTGVANIAPVGTAPLGAGLWGQLDLAGEMWEWTLDWFDYYVDPCVDCAYLTETSPYLNAGRVFRGDSFDDRTSFWAAPDRGIGAPSTRDTGIGFRCARAP